MATGLSDAAERRPNILFIVTDDQSPETLRIYGNTLCETPNIDRLGYEGMVFEDAPVSYTHLTLPTSDLV